MAKVYLGETEIAPVVEVPVPETKYGCPIGGLLGDVDANGNYQVPTEPFTLDMSAVKSLPNVSYILAYKFYKSNVSGVIMGLEGNLNMEDAMLQSFSECPALTTVDLSSLTTVSGSSALSRCFYKCPALTTVDLSSLTTVSGSYGMNRCFSECPKLTNIDLSSLTTVSGNSSMESCFQGCPKLTNIDLSSLTTVSGSMLQCFWSCAALTSVDLSSLTTVSGSMGNCFYACAALTSVDLSSLTTVSGTGVMGSSFKSCSSLPTISFPSLKEILPSTTQNQFNNMFSGCTALTEIHFPVNMQERIEQLTGYSSKFGATNATIYFDLPSTAEE